MCRYIIDGTNRRISACIKGNRVQIMIINSQPPITPAQSREPVRPQNTADSSPESTVVQKQRVAPVPDVKVVQQANETASYNALKDPSLDVEPEASPQALSVAEKKATEAQGKANPGDALTGEVLTDDELRQIEQLASRDREVRAHEQAHLSAAGNRATSGASFTYTDGPDGQRYATGGEVSINTSPVHGDPEATLRAAELIQRAALAPASPSAQDRQVAAAANAMAQVATVELSQQQAEAVREASSVEQSSSAIDGSSEALDSESIEATAGVSSEVAREVVVDSRNAQVMSRQQQLEDAYGVVQQRRDDNERGESLGNVISSAEPGNSVQQNVAQAPGVDVSVQSRQGGAEVSAAVAPVSVDEGDQTVAAKESQVASVALARPAASAVTEASVVNGAASQESAIDVRDEQVKNRQSQIEGAFNSVAQGLGGEPRGTNLDYFL
jgi:hypothetical protein